MKNQHQKIHTPVSVRNSIAAMAALAALLAAQPSSRAGVVDPAGDLLSTFTGPHNGDLDVVFADFTYDPSTDTFLFTSDQADFIGLTAGAQYVWGIDRGQGTERFVGGTPSVGAGVKFDSIVILRPDTTVTVRDLISGVATNFGAGKATVSGQTISAQIAGSLLPTFGAGFLTKHQYTTNLWPRGPGAGNATISDFAPDASNFQVRVVPEPASLAMLALGLAAPAALLRRIARR